MPPPTLPGPQNYPPPTEAGGVHPQAGQIPRDQSQIQDFAQAQEFEQPPPQPEQPAAQSGQPDASGGDAEKAPHTPKQPPHPIAPAEGQPAAPPENPVSTSQDDEKAARQKLETAIEDSNEVLATATTVFPITLFPDTYTIDRAKITVARRSFFGSAETMSMRIEDVLNATATVGPMLGSIKLMNRIANEQPYTIGPFWRADAIKLKRLTQGYVIAIQKEIDVSPLDCNELARMLERLGEDHPPTNNTAEPAA